MGQQTTTKVSVKVDNSYLTQGNQDQEFFQTITRVTDLKSLDQAIHNIDLGLELLDKSDAACEKIETILGQIKQLAAPGGSNLDASRHYSLNVNISLNKKELDLLYNSIQFKGKKILDGSLSASRNPDQHFYLMAGVMGFPKNRINLNIGLNIPKISSKTLGLGTTFFISTAKKEGFKIMIVLENAMGIIHRLKKRSLALRDLLQQNKKSHDISIANHQAAESAPESLAVAEEFLRTINKLDHKY